MPEFIQKSVEYLFIKLINLSNLMNNDHSGECFIIENFNPHQHVFFALDLLKKAYILVKNQYLESTNCFSSWSEDFQINSQESTNSIKSIELDNLISITPFQNISQINSVDGLNLVGQCQDKNRFRRCAGKDSFEFYLINGLSSIKVRSLSYECFNLLQVDKYYLLRDVRSEIFKSGNEFKLRIVIDQPNQIQLIKVYFFIQFLLINF